MSSDWRDTKINRGKPWSGEDDRKLMSNPECSDHYFATQLGRSETAIQYRRAHLAARMHRMAPNLGLEEAVHLMHADGSLVEQIIEQGRAEQCLMDTFLCEQLKKRSAVPPPAAPVMPESPNSSMWFGLADKAQPAQAPVRMDSDAPRVSLVSEEGLDETLRRIANGIEFEGGRLGEFWRNPECVPYLIQFYPGFRAWAEHCAQNI